MRTIKTKVLIAISLFLAGGIAVLFFWTNFRDALPLLAPAPPREPPTVSSSPPGSPARPTPRVATTTGIPLTLPAGFSISVFADHLPGVRVMAFDSFKNMWVSEPSEGVVSLLEVRDGKVVNQNAVFRNLKNPHGLAFDPAHPFNLYIAEEDKVSRAPTYSEGGPEKVASLPAGGNHWTRTLGFGPDGRLYVSIGSSCNVCNESNDMRAKILSMNPDGSDLKEYARGLRNAVFFTWDAAGKMWATDMGRDLLGDDLPPDEINIVKGGANYGWPICYGQNIHDTNFDKNTYIRNPCMEPFETPSFIDLPAHSAPLGLAFVPKTAGWPTDYQNDLLVAYHGSWNRTMPTGYKIVRIKFDAKGTYGGIEDFISGWLSGGTVYGRPVNLVFGPDRALYVSDDRAGVIYKVSYASQ